MFDSVVDPDKVELIIDGTAYAGWTEIEIDLSLDNLAHSFTLSLTEKAPGALDQSAVAADAACRVTIGGETVITGYADVSDASLTGDDHSMTVSGRSKAGDLVDCSAIHIPGSWSGRKLEAIASELAAPFGITVTAKVDTGAAFAKFALQSGETVWAAIERMLKMRGLLAVSTADGNIEIISPKAGSSGVKIVQGEHLLSLSAKHDVRERFSSYLLKGQAAGNDEHNGKAVAHPKASASDPAVKRRRPLLIIAEDQASAESLKSRAMWEATVRAAKAQEASVSVVDWRDPAGKLWTPQTMVSLTAPALSIVADLMIAGVTFKIDSDSGKTATLRLVYPDAYKQLPVPEEAKSDQIRKKKP